LVIGIYLEFGFWDLQFFNQYQISGYTPLTYISF